MTKVLMSMRLGKIARAELEALADRYRTTMTEAMEVAIHRLFAQEFGDNPPPLKVDDDDEDEEQRAGAT